MLQICQNIRLEREVKGFSQTKMADELNVSRTTYRNWEESTEPSMTILKSIADTLEISPFKLLRGVLQEETSVVNEPQAVYETAPKMEAAAIIVLQKELAAMQVSLDRLTTIASRLGVQAPAPKVAVQDLRAGKKAAGAARRSS